MTLLAPFVTVSCSRSGAVTPVTSALPHRIVALTSAAVDTLADLDELDRVVGVEEDCTVDGVEGKVRIRNDDHAGPARPLNVEAVLALRPDAVIAKASLKPALGGRGLRVMWTPDRTGLGVVPDLVRRIGELVGAEDRAEALIRRLKSRVTAMEAATAGLPRVRVYFEDGAPGRTAGDGTVINDMIRVAGGTNIAGAQPLPHPVMNQEAIVAADPEVIVLSPWSVSPEELAKRPGWGSISAVRSGRVHKIPFDRRRLMYSSPHCIDGCEALLLPWIHPEIATVEGGH